MFKSNVGEEKDVSLHFISITAGSRAGTQGRSPETGTETESLKKQGLLSCSSEFSQPDFFLFLLEEMGVFPDWVYLCNGPGCPGIICLVN